MTRALAAVLVAIALAALGLRVFRLDDVPPGFFIDESAVGADAISLAATGHDIHGTPHPVLFRAIEDWKHPLTVYAAAASVRALGPTRFAVRLEAAVFGALAVLALGFLAFELTLDPRVAVASALGLAVMPWHVHMSRLAWGGPEAFTFPILVALGLHFRARRLASTPLFALAGAAFALELYTYAPAKLLVPAFLLVLAAIEVREARWVTLIRGRALAQAASSPDAAIAVKGWETPVPRYPIERRQAALLALVLAAVAAPMVVAQVQHFEEVQTRFQAISAFREPDPLQAIAKSYAAHLDPRFIFVMGDANLRHGSRGWGELLLATAPLCVFGLWRLVRRRQPEDLLQLAWVFLYPLGACLTTEGVPHASRSLLGAPIAALLAGHGVAWLLDRTSGPRARVALASVLLALVLGNAGLWLRWYLERYPFESASVWNEGAEELIHALEARRGELAKVHFAQTSGLGPVRADVLFFARSTPAAEGPAPADPYWDWVPPHTSLAWFLKEMKRDEVLVERFDEEHPLGIPPEKVFLDRTGRRGFAVYRSLAR